MKYFALIFLGIFFLFGCNDQKTNVNTTAQQDVKQDSIVTYAQTKVESMIRYMRCKQDFDNSGKMNAQVIKQMVVDLTSNRSTTQPELPKLHLITGILFCDLGKNEKAIEYYLLELRMSGLAEKTGLEEALKQNWRRSKIESLILLGKTGDLKKYLSRLKPKLAYTDYKELFECSKFKKNEIYRSYSLKIKRNKDLGVVLF